MSSPEIISVTDFPAYLAQHPDPYRDCDVFSITHSKNLDSPVRHEYIHLVIRHRTSNRWRRLLVERQTHQDQVIIGIWPWVPEGDAIVSSGGGSTKNPLPLLMRNIRFESLSIQDAADILLKVHNQRRKYHVKNANCFWYADAVFHTLFGAVGSASHTEWSFIKFRGKFAIWNPFVIARIRAAARKFKKQIITEPIRGPIGDNVQDPGSEDEDMYDIFPKALQAAEHAQTNPDASAVEDEETECVTWAMRQVDLISNLDESAIRSITEERKADIVAFSDAVLASPEKDADLAFYKSRVHENEVIQLGQESDREFIAKLAAAVTEIGSANAPSKEEEERYEEAIRAFAGGILRRSD